MRKLKEVLRLDSLGLSQRQIAHSCSISQSTVHEYVSAAQGAGVKWPVAENWDDQQIEQTLFPQRPATASGAWPPVPLRLSPDYRAFAVRLIGADSGRKLTVSPGLFH